MSVYVDARSRADDRTGIASHSSSGSHLMADTLEELLTFGSRIGLRAGWLTVEPGGVHFELNSGERVQAIRAGAVEVEALSVMWRRVVQSSRAQFLEIQATGMGIPVKSPVGEFW